MDYELVLDDGRLKELAEIWEREGRAVAVDFEEECNLHAYGEHICTMQLYDGSFFYLVDVLSAGVTKAGLGAFFSADIEKLWFECRSDLSILFKKYGIRTKRVYDLRVLAKALGESGGLGKVLSSFLMLPDSGNKKRNQQENWMKRPLSDSQINYALDDVRYLFLLRKELEKRIERNGLENQVERAMANIAAVNPGKPGWMKLANVRALNHAEKVYLKNLFNAREAIAERFNVPAVNVLDKREVLRISLKCSKCRVDMEKELEKAPSRFKNILISAFEKAAESSASELEGRTDG